MVSVIELMQAMAVTFTNIPELVALLENPAPVTAYIDENPTRNSVSKAIYQMPSGSLLLAWSGTSMDIEAETMLAWTHAIQVYIRASRGGSALAVIDALVDGIPVPGDGLRWRYCPLISGVLPTVVTDMARLIDEEGIDYYVVSTATQETGDN